MKLLRVAGLACAIGFGAGYATGWYQRLDDPTLAMRSQMREAVSSQNYATALSLGVLLALEKGDISGRRSPSWRDRLQHISTRGLSMTAYYQSSRSFCHDSTIDQRFSSAARRTRKGAEV